MMASSTDFLLALDLDLADDTNCWVLGPDSKWSRVPTTTGVSVQRRLQELARERVRRRLDPEVLGTGGA